jgi:hypothetical protein
VEFRSATIEEAFGYFFRKSAELDTSEPNQARKGIRGSLAPDIAVSRTQPQITLSVRSIPAIEVLKYMTKIAKLEYAIQEDGSVLVQNRSSEAKLETRTYRVPKGGMNRQSGSSVGPDGKTYASVQELFSAFGVAFPAGASAGITIEGRS